MLISASPLAYASRTAIDAADMEIVRRNARARSGPAGSQDAMLKPADDIAQMIDYWDQTDAIIDGIRTMREAGDKYLPRFIDEEDEEYLARLKFTKMTNVYRDIVESLSAKPFERDVDVKGDNALIADFAKNVDGAGNNVTTFANLVFFNAINSAIDWIYVDYPKRDPNIRSIADAKAAGLRPYWSRVLARNVIKATSEMIGGVETLTFIRIYEPGTPDHIREFQRHPIGAGLIEWTLYKDSGQRNTETNTSFVVEESGTLTINKIPLIPFLTGRRNGRTWRIFPALQDASDLQVELYQQESGLKFAKNLTAYPMLSGNGIRPEKEQDGKTIKKIRVGPNRVLYAPPDGAGNSGSWSYVEPSSESLKFLAADCESTIKELRELGRQPLTVQSSNLTTVTTQVAAGKAKSAIKQWAIGLENALDNALTLTCEYMQIDNDVVVDVFTEFDEFYDDKSLDSLAKDRDRGDISRASYWREMKRRGVYAPEFDADEEEKRLLSELPGDGIDTDGPGADPANED